MPDFTYKRKTPGAATSCATAASTSPKESEKSAEGAKAQTPSASATASSNFVRNGGKYATMVPVTKRASGELEGEADGERRHSDVDLVSEEGDDGKEQPEKGISSDSQEATNSTKSAERTTKSDGYGGDDDEICRPVDKNDVDWTKSGSWLGADHVLRLSFNHTHALVIIRFRHCRRLRTDSKSTTAAIYYKYERCPYTRGVNY